MLVALYIDKCHLWEEFKAFLPLLQAFIHVSTAYCNCDQAEVHEMVYTPPADPERVIKCVESLDDDIIDSITDR